MQYPVLKHDFGHVEAASPYCVRLSARFCESFSPFSLVSPARSVWSRFWFLACSLLSLSIRSFVRSTSLGQMT